MCIRDRSWSFGTLPDGWQVGFASTAAGGLVKGGSTSVTLSLTVAPGSAPGPSGTLSVIIDAETLDGGKQFQKVAELGIVVEPSLWLIFDTDSRIELAQGDVGTANLSITNSGNIACDVELIVESPEGLTVDLGSDTLSAMGVGETRILEFTFESSDLRGLQDVTFLSLIHI